MGRSFQFRCSILTEGIYVDDATGTADSIEEALGNQNQLTLLLKCACFKLRKWASNAAVPEGHQQPSFGMPNLPP